MIILVAECVGAGAFTVAGNVRRERRLIRSWGSDRRCVAYAFRDSTGVTESGMTPFWIEDASGRAFVVGPRVVVDLPFVRTAGPAPALIGGSMLARRGNDGWFEEAIVEVGQRIVVTGDGVVEPEGEARGAGGPFRAAATRVRFASGARAAPIVRAAP